MSVNSEILSPAREPTTVKKSNGVGVRRVNNLPIWIFGTIMLVFMLLMMIVAMNRATEHNQHATDNTQDAQSSQNFASLIAKDYVGGMIEPKNPPAVPDSKTSLPGMIIERPTDLDRPPMPPGVQSSNSVQDPDLAHIRMLKRQQLEEAIKAKTQVNIVAPRSSASAPSVAPKNARGNACRDGFRQNSDQFDAARGSNGRVSSAPGAVAHEKFKQCHRIRGCECEC